MLSHPDQTLVERIRRIIEEEGRIAVGSPDKLSPIVVGVSGGPDSLCLMHLLYRLELPLVVAHFDHALRPESAEDARAVLHQAQELGLRAVTDRQDAGEAARREGLSIEEASRNLRYRFLFRIAQDYRAAAVAVAHSADDQVETFLMHLLRGVGTAGLRGMAVRSLPNAWSRTVPLLRPLLAVWRSEIQEFLDRNHIQALEDASNQDWRFYRNRLRGEALPYLDSLNPGLRARFHQTAAILRDEDDLIEAAADQVWLTCLAEANDGSLALKAEILKSQPVALQRRLLRRAAARLRPGLRDIDYAAIQRGIEFLASPTRSGQANWTARLTLEMDGPLFRIREDASRLPSAWPQVPPSSIELQLPGEIDLVGGWRLLAEVQTAAPAAVQDIQENSNAYHAWLDRAALPETLTVRSRLPGDRFRPLGMDGHSIKLSDFMIILGLPRRARAAWPLVTTGEEIAWVPGYRLAQPFCVTLKTREIVHLHLLHRD